MIRTEIPFPMSRVSLTRTDREVLMKFQENLVKSFRAVSLEPGISSRTVNWVKELPGTRALMKKKLLQPQSSPGERDLTAK